MSAAAASVVRVLLLSRSPTSLLGAPPRIYAMAAPQGTARPYIVYGRTSGQPEYHLRGEGGLARMVVQIEAWTDTYADLLKIEDLLRLTLSGFHGPVVVDGTTYSVRRMHFTNEDEGVVSPLGGGSTPIFHLTKELETDVTQAIPSI